MTEIFAIVGNPVIHSKSPEMHNAAFRSEGIDAVYTRIAGVNATEVLQTAREIGVSGINITSPFKEEFANLADELDESATATGMVNTMVIKDGKNIGYNTDTVGVIATFLAHDIKLEGKNAVIIGAGGAAAAAAYTLTSVGANVTIANRTVENAEKLAKKFNCGFCSLDESELGKVIPNADVIISTVSALHSIIPSNLLRPGTVIFDANYAGKSELIKEGLDRGCKVIDGTEWLLFQGLRAFEIFTGRKAPADVMQNAVMENPGRKINIALIGFMGSGKSTVARELAKRTGMEVIDIDLNIQEKTGMPIDKIFESKGEGEFRRMEKEEIGRAVQAGNSIIDCGGGAVLDGENVRALGESCVIVWLWASKEAIIARTKGDNARPLLANAEKIFPARIPIYSSACNIIVDTTDKKPEEVAELIVDELNSNTVQMVPDQKVNAK